MQRSNARTSVYTVSAQLLKLSNSLSSNVCPKIKVLRLTNNRTKVFRSIFTISFASDRCDINLYFDISFSKIGQISTELEDQNAVNHEISEFFHFGCYMAVHVCIENFIYISN